MANQATANEIREAVRERYAGAARQVMRFKKSGCRGGSGCGPSSALYNGLEIGEVPAKAAMASLGCGNPTLLAELKPGEVVLDLGSGGGIDVLLSARRVGPTGKAYGPEDVPDEMRCCLPAGLDLPAGTRVISAFIRATKSVRS